ncbi:coiled-coil domain-containing protein 159 isoform X3 [Nycticebus coucang]|uniref:coiled-coil domain-containing protein 159 isoform X3 n=1 Tax=Nycticebus coucang TaxID=9470 RepID=UPI00234CE003|nr:coiled-coil domain-containing protein 159 isoform X3 [Nycticebus coucang]
MSARITGMNHHPGPSFFSLSSSEDSFLSLGSSESFVLPSPIPGAGIIFHTSTIKESQCSGHSGVSERHWHMEAGLKAAPIHSICSDPLLAGVPRDSEYSVSYLPSPSSPSVCLPANGKCDKYWGSLGGCPGTGGLGGAGNARNALDWPSMKPSPPGSASDKTLHYTTHWSRTSETETVEPAVSEDTVRSVDWRTGWGLGPQPQGTPSFSNPDLLKERCNDQDLLKRLHSIAKKPVEASSSKVKAKSIMVVSDSQKLLRCELESLRSQLQAQTKAFEFLNHSVTMLEKESCLQQIKIQHLEEVLSPTGRKGEKDGPRWGMEQGRQELYEALAQGLEGLQKTLRDSEELQRVRTTRCLQLLAQEIQDCKKFLWEELELVREDVNFMYKKLQLQEGEISENLVNIQKMQKTQVKCRKMKQQSYDTPTCLETEEMLPGGSGCWKDELQKELSDIWAAVHVLQDSIDSLTMCSRARPRDLSLKGHKGQWYVSSPLHSWDSDSDSDQGLFQPPYSKSRSFPPGA